MTRPRSAAAQRLVFVERKNGAPTNHGRVKSGEMREGPGPTNRHWKPAGRPSGFRYYRIGCFLAHGLGKFTAHTLQPTIEAACATNLTQIIQTQPTNEAQIYLWF